MSDHTGPIPIVVGVIRNQDGKLLLQKRVDPYFTEADAHWEFPGGKIDFGESPESAVVREVKEETGCDVEVTRVLPILQSRTWKGNDGKHWHIVLMSYECKLIGGTPQALDNKVAEVGWFSHDEIATMKVLAGVSELIQALG